MSKIKPCPFCGSYDLGCAPLFRPLPDFEDDGNQWVVQCRSCETRFVTRSMTKPELIEYWNRRTSDYEFSEEENAYIPKHIAGNTYGEEKDGGKQDE